MFHRSSCVCIGVCGDFEVGKDTAADFLVEDWGFTKLAFADPVYEGALRMNPWINVPREVGAQLEPSAWERIKDRGGHTNPFLRLSQVVEILGWRQAKSIPDVRRLLQTYGTDAGREIHGQDCWVRAMERNFLRLCYPEGRQEQQQPAISLLVITGLRFANEETFIRHGTQQGVATHDQWQGFIWRVERAGFASGKLSDHKSEEYKPIPDFVIRNDGTLEDLRHLVALTLAHMALPKPKGDSPNASRPIVLARRT